jgi:hypothetical protein
MKFYLNESKTDIINGLASSFEMSTTPVMGPSYIFPDGRFILIPEPEQMGASIFVRYRCHSLLHLWLVSQKLVNKTLWDINGMTDVLDAGAIKVNLGSIPDADALLNYIELPKKRPTTAQFSAIIGWLDLAQSNGIYEIEVNTYNQGRYKKYSLKENTSDEVVAKIKRYYSSGTLYEDFTEKVNPTKTMNESIDQTTRELLYELNSLPVNNGWKTCKYELVKEYEEVLSRFPVGTVLTHETEAGEETLTKVDTTFWEHHRAPWGNDCSTSEFDVAHWFAARGNISRSPITMKNPPQEIEEDLDTPYTHRYYLCGNYGLVGTPYPKSVTREEAERKLASGHLLPSWGYVHEMSTRDDGIRREVYPLTKLLTTPEDFDKIEAKLGKHLPMREGFGDATYIKINEPEGHIHSGAIYKQVDDFKAVEHDWNNDGDVYTEKVATFEYVCGGTYDSNPYAPKSDLPQKRIVYRYEDFLNDLKSGEIEKVPAPSVNESLLTEDIEAVRKNYPKISDEDFNRLISLDPTFDANRDAVGTYGKWILTQFQKGRLDNEGHVRDALARFEEEKKYLKNKDIGQFKSIEEIDAYLDNDDNYKSLSHRQEVRQRQKDRKNVDLEQDAVKVFETANWVVWIPKSYAASCRLGQGSSWCTASTESDYYYNYYTKYGDLYINKHKTNEDEMYQFHFETSSFMDKEDSSVDLYYFLQDNPELKEFYYDIVAKSLNLDMKADKCDVTFTEDELHDLLQEWDSRYCTRDQVGYDGIKKILNGDIWEWFDYPFELPYELPTPSKYVIAELERLHLTVEDLEEIFEGDSELDIADEILDCLKHANYEANIVGAESEMWDDLIRALSYPGGAGEGFFSDYAGGKLTIVASPNAIMKVYMETLGGNIEETGERFNDNLKNILGYMWMSDFKFHEPYYGWNGFDEDAFNDRLADELGDIETPAEKEDEEEEDDE